MLVFDCAIKLLSLVIKSLAPVNMGMVAARCIDNENRRLLNSRQRGNTGHKLCNQGELCWIFLFQMILSFNHALRQAYSRRSKSAEGHERISCSQRASTVVAWVLDAQLCMESHTWVAETMYSRKCEKKGWVETSAWRDEMGGHVLGCCDGNGGLWLVQSVPLMSGCSQKT